jgi:hypothetical protein
VSISCRGEKNDGQDMLFYLTSPNDPWILAAAAAAAAVRNTVLQST